AGSLPEYGDRWAIQGGTALRQLAGDRLRLNLPRGLPRDARRLRVLPLPRSAGGRSAVLHPVDKNDAADRGGDSDLSDVPPVGADRHPSRYDPALHGGERLARRVAAQGIHRRDTARVRGSRYGRWVHAASRVFQGGAP